MELTKRQKEILKISIMLIAEGGIQNLTTKHISQEIGTSEPAIYRHFKSKDDILLTIIESFKEKYQIIAENVLKSKLSFKYKIELFYQEMLKQFCDFPEITSVIFAEDIFQNRAILSKHIKELMMANQKTIITIIAEAKENKEIGENLGDEQIAIIIMGSLRLLVTRWKLSNFSFDLISEGQLLINVVQTLLIKEVK